MGVVSNNWSDRVVLSIRYMFKPDRCPNPLLPWDPLSSSQSLRVREGAREEAHIVRSCCFAASSEV